MVEIARLPEETVRILAVVPESETLSLEEAFPPGQARILEVPFSLGSEAADGAFGEGLATQERTDILLVALPSEVEDSETLEGILEALFGMTKAVTAQMMRNRRGRIVLVVRAAESAGALKKALLAAVESFTGALSREVASRGIAVNLIQVCGNEPADTESIRFAALAGAVSGQVLAPSS